MHKVIIIGGGPAGISAGIYLIRAGIDVLIIDNNRSSLLKTEKIENYYGFETPISGKELYEKGQKQFKRLGGNIINDEIVSLNYENNFIVIGKESYECEYLIIATGASKLMPNIKGLEEGPHISFCAICDAFFYRNKRVAVLGSGLYALSEASHLKDVTSDVTILTNGNDILDDKFNKENNIIEHIENNGNSINVYFTDTTKQTFDGLFIAEGVAGAGALSKKIGIKLNDNSIDIDENRKTNIPNIYAIGDCVVGTKQIAKAVNDGMMAALDIIRKKK